MSDKDRQDGLIILAKMEREAPKVKIQFENLRLRRTESIKNLIKYMENPYKYKLIIV